MTHNEKRAAAGPPDLRNYMQRVVNTADLAAFQVLRADAHADGVDLAEMIADGELEPELLGLALRQLAKRHPGIGREIAAEVEAGVNVGLRAFKRDVAA